MDFSRRVHSERGTMIPMYVLFMLIIIAMLTIVMDTTQVYLQRRSLQGVADGASLAAADGIDESSLYDDGLKQGDRVELAYGQASAAVGEYQNMVNQNRPSADRHVRCAVGDIQTNRVQVTCSGIAVLPLVNSISQAGGFGASVDVQAVSWADASIAG